MTDLGGVLDPAVALGVALGVVGLVIGSFLNVVIWRVPRGESVVSPAQRVPELRARGSRRGTTSPWCRGCCCAAGAGNAVSRSPPGTRWWSWRGPCCSSPWRFGSGSPGRCRPTSTSPPSGVALALIDLDIHRLPDAIVLPSYPVLAVLLVLASWHPVGTRTGAIWPGRASGRWSWVWRTS